MKQTQRFRPNPPATHMVLNTRSLIHVILLSVLIVSRAVGGEVYVNNQMGDDRYDGSTAAVTDSFGGPVRSFTRAVRLAKKGDTISIANTGVDYHDSLQLTGWKNSGFKSAPFIVDGNGATFSGARTVPRRAWRHLKDGIWQVRPIRKGHYLLLLDGKMLKEEASRNRYGGLFYPPESQWSVWQGSMIYNAPANDMPSQQEFSFAYETTGISLFNVRHVRIRNLTLKHYRVDGLSAHDLSSDVVLQDVTCIENGRAGMSVAGTSGISLEACTLKDNRENSLRISELGVAEVEDSIVKPAPVLID